MVLIADDEGRLFRITGKPDGMPCSVRGTAIGQEEP